MKIKKNCVFCKKEYITYQKNQKFCSVRCWGDYLSKFIRKEKHPRYIKRLMKKCLKCGKEFEIKPKENRKYCNNECCKYSKKGIWVEITCCTCGKKMEIALCRVTGAKRFCSKRCAWVWINKNMKHKDTYIEKKIENELIKRNINFKKQSSIMGITLADFVLDNKIIIQCDGDYWHSFKRVKNRDKKQGIVLKANGYRVYRFTETEINMSAKNCINKVELE